MENLNNTNIAIIGLGYVGLPLYMEFSKLYKTIGFDLDFMRIKELNDGFDRNKEITQIESKNFSNNESDLLDFNVFIICVPTPIDNEKNPDITLLLNACEMIARVLKKQNLKKLESKPIIVFESTTFPGCTNSVCAPLIESKSGLMLNKDFFVGYSPERINPGDKTHTLTNIKKITSGSNEFASKRIDSIYKSIIKAGTHLVKSIEIAEATKAIENAQRDINIAFMNEIYMLLDSLNIEVSEVLKAAKTKWNFLDFKPGLVGGHCICIDPYYLAYSAKKVSFTPKLIYEARNVNDSMSGFLAKNLLKKMAKNRIEVLDSNVLLVGWSFKANCADCRESKSPEIKKELESYGLKVSVLDPLVESSEFIKLEDLNKFSFKAILIIHRHENLKQINFNNFLSKNGVLLELE